MDARFPEIQVLRSDGNNESIRDAFPGLKLSQGPSPLNGDKTSMSTAVDMGSNTHQVHTPLNDENNPSYVETLANLRVTEAQTPGKETKRVRYDAATKELKHGPKHSPRKVKGDGDGNYHKSVVDSIPPTIETQPTETSTPRKGGQVIIHCVRHAQAEHNLPTSDRWSILDPALTPLGRKQALHLQKSFKPMDHITTIYCSPLQRAFQTCVLGFEPLLKAGHTIFLYPDLRERGVGPSATGSPISVLKEELKKYGGINLKEKVNFALMTEGWEAPYLSKREEVVRAEMVKRTLCKIGEEILNSRGDGRPRINAKGNVEILVVSHGGFLAALEGSEKETYRNTQYKSYEFASDYDIQRGASPYKLVETTSSKYNAARSQIPFTL